LKVSFFRYWPYASETCRYGGSGAISKLSVVYICPLNHKSEKLVFMRMSDQINLLEVSSKDFSLCDVYRFIVFKCKELIRKLSGFHKLNILTFSNHQCSFMINRAIHVFHSLRISSICF